MVFAIPRSRTPRSFLRTDRPSRLPPRPCRLQRETTLEPERQTVPVRFAFYHTTARNVCVAGSFNNWAPTATPLVQLRGGHWLRLLWLPQGAHEYLFVADGVWFLDPHAGDYVPNVYGTLNSVVVIDSRGGEGRTIASLKDSAC